MMLRFAKKALLVLFLLFALPAFAWWVYNRIDEQPTAKALYYATPWTNDLEDGRNAWLVLVGITAVSDADPAAYGRQRVDAYARLRVRPAPDADPRDKAVFEDPTPYVESDGGSGKDEKLCAVRSEDCIDWAAAHAPLLAKLEASNARLLERYDRALGMAGFEEISQPSLREPEPFPFVALRVGVLRANLLARDAAAGGDPAIIAAELARTTTFWRNVDLEARSVGAKLAAIALIERQQRTLSALIDRADARQLSAMNTSVVTILLAPPEIQRDWRPTLRHSYQVFANEMASAMPGTIAIAGRCLAGTADCPKDLLMQQAYVPQATLNLLASHYADSEAFLDSTPDVYYQTERQLGVAREKVMPLGDAQSPVELMAYNLTGKVLAFIALPALDWVARNHDLDALRRMVSLKYAARQARVTSTGMAAWLREQPEWLTNPYDGEPFGWDAARMAITFAPVATQYWKTDEFVVGLASRRSEGKSAK